MHWQRGTVNPIARVVKTVNGISIRNLSHLVQVLRDSNDEFDVITYWGKGNESMVFPRKKCGTRRMKFSPITGFRSQGSQQVLTVWGAKKGTIGARSFFVSQ